MDSQAENLPIVEVNSPEAKRLADLTSIYQDLEFTIQVCRKLLDLMDSKSRDFVLMQSLWTAALISYVRCFASGKRFGLSEETISHLEGEPIEVHRYYKNLRDKHIAHSVSPFEEFVVGLVLPEQSSSRGEIVSITTFFKKHIVSSKQSIEQLMKLASVLRKEVGDQAKKAKAMVLKKEEKIPLSELYQRPRLKVTGSSPKEAGIARD